MPNVETTPSPDKTKNPRKYFKGRLVSGDRSRPFVVWNGVKGYSSLPPLPALAELESLTGEIGVVQIKNPKADRATLEILITTFDSVVLWTRDHSVYRSVVKTLTEQSDLWMQ